MPHKVPALIEINCGASLFSRADIWPLVRLDADGCSEVLPRATGSMVAGVCLCHQPDPPVNFCDRVHLRHAHFVLMCPCPLVTPRLESGY
jgi:hypothetical protein